METAIKPPFTPYNLRRVISLTSALVCVSLNIGIACLFTFIEGGVNVFTLYHFLFSRQVSLSLPLFKNTKNIRSVKRMFQLNMWFDCKKLGYRVGYVPWEGVILPIYIRGFFSLVCYIRIRIGREARLRRRLHRFG